MNQEAPIPNAAIPECTCSPNIRSVGHYVDCPYLMFKTQLQPPPVPESPLHVNPSGQTSSHRAPHFDTIPVNFLLRMGRRFQLGDDKHGRGNRMLTYQPSNQEGTVGNLRYDIDALRDRYNHAIEHLLALHEGTSQDDHIGAVAWFLAYASEAEEHGVNWQEVLMTRTPAAEAKYREEHGLLSKSKVATPTPILDSNRCAICGWPLAKNMAEGCVRGSCSHRPFPAVLYDLSRAEREYGPIIYDWVMRKAEAHITDAGDRPITQTVAITGRTGVVPCDLDGLNKPDLDVAAPRIIDGADRATKTAANEGVLGCTGDPCVCKQGWGHRVGKPIPIAVQGEGEKWPRSTTNTTTTPTTKKGVAGDWRLDGY